MNVAVHPPAARPLNLISLCTGGGGLDRAVELAIPGARPVLLVEREAFAVAHLVAQMQDGVMAAAPVWSDVRSCPGRRFRGLVDGVIGGIPCQPFSLAGKRLGRADERDLWGAARRIFVQSGAYFILIENVGGMLSEGGAERVRGDLLRLGCQVEGGLFSAAEVGASHERERLFILGVADRDGQYDHGRVDERAGGRPEPAIGCADLADASGPRSQGCGSYGNRPGQCATAERNSSDVGDSQGVRWRKGRSEPTVRGGRTAAASDGRQLADSERDGWRQGAEDIRGRQSQPAGSEQDVDDAARLHRGLHPRRGEGGGRAADAGGAEQMVHALGRGHDGRPFQPERSAQERAAAQWASEGPLFAPGPGDLDAWRWIAERHPERLPAVSRYDLFRIALRNAGLGEDGRAGAGEEVGARQARAVRAALVSQIAQSTLRGRPDGLAARIDELRMLGNGVVDLAGAYALRTLATRLARRSAGAARLVRMMGVGT